MAEPLPHTANPTAPTLDDATPASPPPSPGGGFWVHGPTDVVASIERVGPALALLAKMMHERAAIERNYASELAKFARKWCSKLDVLGAAPETTLWRGFEVVTEDEPLGTSKLHSECAQKIDIEAEAVTRWRNEMYHSTFGKTAAAKEAHKGFAKAREPWTPIEKELAKTKADFHAKTAVLCALDDQIATAGAIEHPEATAGLEKLRAARRKAVGEVDKARAHYEAALHVAARAAPGYEAAMLTEFRRSEARSVAREATLQSHLARYVAVLDLDHEPPHTFPLHKLHAGLQECVAAIDPQADHVGYARSVGALPGSFPVPVFEPFVPPPQPIDFPRQGSTIAAEPEKVRAAWFVKSGETALSFSQRRFCVLRTTNGPVLEYYAGCKDGVPHTLKGGIPLIDAIALQRDGKALLISTANSRRVWRLTADTEAQAEEWSGYLAAVTKLAVTVVTPVVAAAAAAFAAGAKPAQAPPNDAATSAQSSAAAAHEHTNSQEENVTGAIAMATMPSVGDYSAREHAAATVIQRTYRGYHARRALAARSTAVVLPPPIVDLVVVAAPEGESGTAAAAAAALLKFTAASDTTVATGLPESEVGFDEIDLQRAVSAN